MAAILGALANILPSILPVVQTLGGKAVDTIGKYFDSKKSKVTEIDTKPATILPPMPRQSREYGFRNFPQFEDELYMDNNFMRDSGAYVTPISRSQYSGYNRTGNRGMRLSAAPSFSTYERNNYDVYSNNSLGNGFGDQSILSARNDRIASKSRLGGLVRTRDQVPELEERSFEERSYEPQQKFIRRLPTNTSSRFTRDSVNNLNFDAEIDNLFR